MMEAITVCDKCNSKYKQIVNMVSEIEFMCPNCKTDEHTWLFEIKEDDPDNTPIVLGKGGCGSGRK